MKNMRMWHRFSKQMPFYRNAYPLTFFGKNETNLQCHRRLIKYNYIMKGSTLYAESFRQAVPQVQVLASTIVILL